MSRTINAIMRHMTPKPARPAVETVKRVAASQRGPQTESGVAQRKLRLAFAPSQSAALGKA
jgi:hypothetical protein